MKLDLSYKTIEMQIYDKIPRELVNKLRDIHKSNLMITTKLHSIREKIESHLSDLRNFNVQKENQQINIII